ncbi:hypothetical protein DESC_590052 [Desulfosarcina cetonica]|nr:hypothetical protein DESC_590052 [Desulfosarcina cetonica]
MNMIGDFRVEQLSHHLVEHFDDGDLHALLLKGLGDLDADQAAPDNDGFLAFQGSAFVTDLAGILDGLQKIDPVEIRALDGRHLGIAADGKNQFVVGNLDVGSGEDIDGLDAFVFPLNTFDQGMVFNLDALDLIKIEGVTDHAGGGGHQLIVTLHFTGNIKGQSATGIGEQFALFDDGHFGLGIQAFDSRGGLGATGHAADNDDFLIVLHVNPFLNDAIKKVG